MLRLYESNSEAPVMVKSPWPELALVPSQGFTPCHEGVEICVLALELPGWVKALRALCSLRRNQSTSQTATRTCAKLTENLGRASRGQHSTAQARLAVQ